MNRVNVSISLDEKEESKKVSEVFRLDSFDDQYLIDEHLDFDDGGGYGINTDGSTLAFQCVNSDGRIFTIEAPITDHLIVELMKLGIKRLNKFKSVVESLK